MRRLDYYVGTPLCLAGSVLKRLLSVFSSRRQDKPPQNILFIELSEMGSALLADPAMQKVKRTLSPSIFFAIFKKNRPSLDLLQTVSRENIFVMDDSGLMSIARDSVRFFFWTRRNRIDTVVDLELFSRFTALLTAISGAVHTVGFHAFHSEGLYRGDFLTRRVAYNPHRHIAKNFIALVNALLSDKEETPYSKTVVADDEISIRKAAPDDLAKRAILQRIKTVCPEFDEGRHKLVLFNTNSSDLIPLRRWPQEYYIRLAKMLTDRFENIVILLTGDVSEKQEKMFIAGEVGSSRCVSFAGYTTIVELPQLYLLSALMLTNDAGPAHFASVTDMPVFVLFGPESPDLYGPLGKAVAVYSGLACSPCVTAANHRKSACDDNVCLQIITSEQVFNTLLPALDAVDHAA